MIIEFVIPVAAIFIGLWVYTYLIIQLGRQLERNDSSEVDAAELIEEIKQIVAGRITSWWRSKLVF